MDKAELITQLRAKIQEEYDTLMRGKGIDSDPERVAQRLEELKKQLATNQEVTEPTDKVETGSLVTYEEMGKKFLCLVVPGCLGDMLEAQGEKVACVSPNSKIATVLLGRYKGEEVIAPMGKLQRKLKIIEIE